MVATGVKIGVFRDDERQVQLGIRQRDQVILDQKALGSTIAQKRRDLIAREPAQTAGPASIRSFQKGTSSSGAPRSSSPSASSAATSSTKSPIAMPQRGAASATENTPQGRLFSGNGVCALLALSTQDFISGIAHPFHLSQNIPRSAGGVKPPAVVLQDYFKPGVPSNFFSRLSQQSM